MHGGFECDYCGAAYESEEQVTKHLAEEHDSDELNRIDRRRVEQYEQASLPRLRERAPDVQLSRRTALATVGVGIAGAVVGLGSGVLAQNDPTEINDWYDLDNIRIEDEDDEDFIGGLDGDYELANDLDEDTPGYSEVVEKVTDEFTQVETSGVGFFEGWIEFLSWTPLDSISATDSEGEAVDVEIIDADTGQVEFQEDVDPPDGEGFAVVTFDYTTTDEIFVGFDPIGDVVRPFTGTFDGQGNEIEGLVIDREPEGDVGLFSVVDGVTIENAGLVDVDITGDNRVGSLVGFNIDGDIVGSYVTGDVNGRNNLGGLVGDSSGTVEDSYATSDVNGNTRTGGLVGDSSGTVEDSYTTGDVNGNNLVGGLVGNSSGTVEDSHGTGDIDGDNFVGGLVGENSGTVEDSYGTGDIDGDNLVGGLVGENSGTVEDSYATGDVNGDETVGGLVGNNSFEGNISESYATGNVDSEGDFAGGLVGINQLESDIGESYATGSVDGNNIVGGFVGASDAHIEKSYATGNVDGDNQVGGFIGINFDTVEEAYSTGDVDGSDNVGGFAGRNDGEFSPSASGVDELDETDETDPTIETSYWDQEASSATEAIGSGPGDVTGLDTNEMQGLTPTDDGDSTMDFGFDRDGGDTWFAVVEGDKFNPTAAEDGYPILQAVAAEPQLEAQGILGEPVEEGSATSIDGDDVTISNVTISGDNDE